LLLYLSMSLTKQLYENIYYEEDAEREFNILYSKDRLFFEKYGDDLELIDVEKCQDSGMGDDQHQKP